MADTSRLTSGDMSGLLVIVLWASLSIPCGALEVNMECFPDDTIVITNPDPGTWLSAYAEDSTNICTVTMAADMSTISLTGCKKDDNIVVSLSSSSGDSPTIIGGLDATIFIVHCKEDGISKDVVQGVVVSTLVPTSGPPVTPSVGVTMNFRDVDHTGTIVTSGVVGNTLTWTLEVDEDYYLKVLSCSVNPGTTEDQDTKATVITDGCTDLPNLARSFHPSKSAVVGTTRVYHTALTMFRFLQSNNVFFQCTLLICPPDGQSNCDMTCSNVSKRSLSGRSIHKKVIDGTALRVVASRNIRILEPTMTRQVNGGERFGGNVLTMMALLVFNLSV
ncbi:uncharacterized protein LOC128236050 [Mya arenaria]|uniref:uncharacterized protein LOC128236050 n=1 Tax=Mya arenaria TaxID=6604 RepID=UPI0022E418C8|nr:uncharacterized protein LOC128236050 [Mya arenaria]